MQIAYDIGCQYIASIMELFRHLSHLSGYLRFVDVVIPRTISTPNYLLSNFFLVSFFASPTQSAYAFPDGSCSFIATTPFMTSPIKPTKFHLLNVFSHCHAALFLSSLSIVSSSPISLALPLGSCTTAIRLKCVSSGGYRAILLCKTPITFSGNSPSPQAP